MGAQTKPASTSTAARCQKCGAPSTSQAAACTKCGTSSGAPPLQKKDAVQMGIFYGVLAVAAGYFARDYTVGGFIPVPLFVGVFGAIFLYILVAGTRGK